MIDLARGFRVRVGSQSWLVRGLRGDPGRTAVRETGTVYETRGKAERAIKYARKSHPGREITYTVESSDALGLLTEQQLGVLQHCVGADQYGHIIRGGGRNFFMTDAACADGLICQQLVALGYMVDHGPQKLAAGSNYYATTQEGRRVMRCESKLPPVKTRSQRRYEEYLKVGECFGSFRDFLAYKGPR